MREMIQDFRSIVAGKKVDSDKPKERKGKPERCCLNCRDNAFCIYPRNIECYDNKMKYFVLTPVYGMKQRARGRSKSYRRSRK